MKNVFCFLIGSGDFFFFSLFYFCQNCPPPLGILTILFEILTFFFEIFEIFLSAQPTIFEGNDWFISEKWCFLNIWSEYFLSFGIFGFGIFGFGILDFRFCLIFCLGSAFCLTSPSKLPIFQTTKQCNQECQSRLKI